MNLALACLHWLKKIEGDNKDLKIRFLLSLQVKFVVVLMVYVSEQFKHFVAN